MSELAKSQKEEQLGSAPISKLLWQFSIPAVVAQIVQAIYNVVDRLYIGHGVNEAALAGLTLTFPFMMILTSFGTLIGVGTGALVSIKLGEGCKEEAEKLLGQMVLVKIIFFIVIPFICYLLLDKILLLLGGTPSSIPYAVEYMRVILLGNIFAHLGFGMSGIVRAEGNVFRSMVAMLIGAGANIILDPIFIFGFEMGIRGAAWATNISMFLAMAYCFWHFSSKAAVLKFRPRNMRIDIKTLPKVFSIGLSPFSMQMLGSFVQGFFINAFSLYSSSEAEGTMMIALFGIANSIILLAIIPTFGLSMGLQPIIGYNFGAKKYARIAEAMKKAILGGEVLCLIGMLGCMIFAPYLIAAFTSEALLVEKGPHYLRLACSGFMFIAVSIMTTTYFQSIGRAWVAILFAFMRQGLMLIPLIYFLPMIWGIPGVWCAGPVSDCLAGLVALVVIIFELRKISRILEK
jgi:putative MATE family efflux protein